MENNEDKIKEAQVENVTDEQGTTEGKKSKKGRGKRDFYVELALFFILGILIGIALKTEAVKRITIGFDDYKMRISKQDYNINRIKEELAEKRTEEALDEAENNPDESGQPVEGAQEMEEPVAETEGAEDPSGAGEEEAEGEENFEN